MILSHTKVSERTLNVSERSVPHEGSDSSYVFIAHLADKEEAALQLWPGQHAVLTGAADRPEALRLAEPRTVTPQRPKGVGGRGREESGEGGDHGAHEIFQRPLRPQLESVSEQHGAEGRDLLALRKNKKSSERA